MVSNGGAWEGIVEDIAVPTLNIVFSKANEHGIRMVSVVWSGLDFSSIILVGPEVRSANMSEEEIEKLRSALDKGVTVKFSNKK